MTELTAARLDVIVCKAKIMAEQFKAGALGDSDLKRMVADLKKDLDQVVASDNWNRVPGVAARIGSGVWFPDDK